MDGFITNVSTMNRIPWQVYLICYGGVGLLGTFLAMITMPFWSSGRRLLKAICRGLVGGLFGLIIALSPWIISELVQGNPWPILEMWPFWGGETTGPFTASSIGVLLGSVLAFVISRVMRSKLLNSTRKGVGS